MARIGRGSSRGRAVRRGRTTGRSTPRSPARGNTAARSQKSRTEVAISNQRLAERQAGDAQIDRLRGISQSPTTTTVARPRFADIPNTGSTGLFGGGSPPPAGATGDTFRVDGQEVSQEEFDRVVAERAEGPQREDTEENRAIDEALAAQREIDELAGQAPPEELSGEAVTGLASQLPGLSQDEFAALPDKEQERVRRFLREQNRLDDLERLETQQAEAIVGGSADDQLEISQELLRKKEKDRAIADQTEAEVVAQRALFREQEQATLLGQELDRSEGALKRQQDAITRGLDAQTREFEAAQGQLGRDQAAVGREQEAVERGLAAEERQFGEATAEIGRQRDLLGRTEAGIRRQGNLAARAGQVQQAAAANIAAQSGFASSSALQGASSSAGSVAATAAGDVLTGLVATGVERDRIAGSEGLLQAAFADAQAGATATQAGLTDRLDALSSQGDLLTSAFADVEASAGAARADIADEFGRLSSERFKLGTHAEDIAFEQERLRDQLEGNIDFLQDTFRLGGDVGNAQSFLSAQRDRKADRDRQRQELLSSVSTGAAIGGSIGGPVGAAIGAGVGGVVALFG